MSRSAWPRRSPIEEVRRFGAPAERVRKPIFPTRTRHLQQHGDGGIDSVCRDVISPVKSVSADRHAQRSEHVERGPSATVRPRAHKRKWGA